MKKIFGLVGILLLCAVAFFVGVWKGQSENSVVKNLTEEGCVVVVNENKEANSNFVAIFDLDVEKVERTIIATNIDDDMGMFIYFKTAEDAKEARDNIEKEIEESNSYYEEFFGYVPENSEVIRLVDKCVYVGPKSLFDIGMGGISILDVLKF